MSYEEVKVSCLGPSGSFSQEFAIAQFPGADICPVDGGFDAVAELVALGECDFAVLPFLNSSGINVEPVHKVLGALAGEVFVVGCFPHEVIHHVVVDDAFLTLQKLVSKEQVFPQCSEWRASWKGELEQEYSKSTSAGLRDLLRADLGTRQTTGVICNELAVSNFGGSIRYRQIQNRGNTTLFLVIQREKPSITDRLVVCLNCPDQECYDAALHEFSKAGAPLFFTSLKGKFTTEIPKFLEFEVSESLDQCRMLAFAEAPHRTLLGSYTKKDSISNCISRLLD